MKTMLRILLTIGFAEHMLHLLTLVESLDSSCPMYEIIIMVIGIPMKAKTTKAVLPRPVRGARFPYPVCKKNENK